tara:strand:+ start:265 stop:705 length:441 start_codon:yes stop_codon:yes gene_type:complete
MKGGKFGEGKHRTKLKKKLRSASTVVLSTVAFRRGSAGEKKLGAEEEDLAAVGIGAFENPRREEEEEEDEEEDDEDAPTTSAPSAADMKRAADAQLAAVEAEYFAHLAERARPPSGSRAVAPSPALPSSTAALLVSVILIFIRSYD